MRNNFLENAAVWNRIHATRRNFSRFLTNTTQIILKILMSRPDTFGDQF